MLDAKILSACIESRRAYDKIHRHITPKELGPHVAQWWKLVDHWYKADKKATRVDLDLLISKGKRNLPEKHLDSLLAVIEELPEAPSPDNVAGEVLDLKRYNLEMQLAGMIANREDQPKIAKLAHELSDLHKATTLNQSDIIVAGGLEDLDELFKRENLIHFLPKALDDRTDGGAMRGDHVIIFGRVEMGKTLFTINMTAGFLRQKKKVLYVGNEDKIQKIQYRIRSNLSNMSKYSIEKHGTRGIEEANRRAEKFGISKRLSLVHLHPGSISEIDELCDQHRPDVLVLDQIRNIGGGGDGITARLNQVAIDVRALLGKYDILGVSTTQANSPEDKRRKVWLTEDDVDSSRTGLPGQADLLLGIGADDRMLQSGERAISIVKNKLSGNHDGFMCQFDYQRSKVR